MMNIVYIISWLLIFFIVTYWIWFCLYWLIKSKNLINEYKITKNKFILYKLIFIHIIFYVLLALILNVIAFNIYVFIFFILFHLRQYYLVLYKNRNIPVNLTMFIIIFCSLFLPSFGRSCDKALFSLNIPIDRDCIWLEFTNLFWSSCIWKVVEK